MRGAKVDILIPHYRTLGLIRACLKSVLENTLVVCLGNSFTVDSLRREGQDNATPAVFVIARRAGL